MQEKGPGLLVLTVSLLRQRRRGSPTTFAARTAVALLQVGVAPTHDLVGVGIQVGDVDDQRILCENPLSQTLLTPQRYPRR